MQASTRALALSCAALIGVGVANIDIKPQPKQIIHVPVTRTQVKLVTQTKVVHDLAAVPSGTVKRADCHKIKVGTPFRTVIAMYGWPPEDDPMDYADNLYYPLMHVKDQYCDVMFDNNKVDDVMVTF